jgi:hypothetical protein
MTATTWRRARLAGVFLAVALAALFAPLPAVRFVPEAFTSHVALAMEGDPGDQSAVVEPGDVHVFTTVGVRLDTPPGDQRVELRVHERVAGWGDWQELSFDSSEGPDADSDEAAASGDGVVSAPISVHAADGAEVRITLVPEGPSDPGAAESTTVPAATEATEAPAPVTPISSADLVVVGERDRRETVTAVPLAGAAEAPFGINSRASWGARPAASGPEYSADVGLAVVHHSVTPNDYAPSDVPSIIRGIQTYHMNTQGWKDIAYNFVVDKYGGIWEGREGGVSSPVIGAHAKGFNTGTVGIVVLGDFTRTTPTSTALESVARVSGWKLNLHGHDPAESVRWTSRGSDTYPAGAVVTLPRVVGHKDTGATDCPASVHASIGWVQARAAQYASFFRLAARPFGSLDSLATYGRPVRVAGWAVDPDMPGGEAAVRLTVGDSSNTDIARLSRPDVGAAYPSYGPNHGFSIQLDATDVGYQPACVTIIDRGVGPGDTSLGCTELYLTDASGHSPVGDARSASMPTGGSVYVSGTARDPDSGVPVRVHLSVDGVEKDATTTVGGAFTLRGVGLIGGTRRVCVSIDNIGPGADNRFSCFMMALPGSAPLGRVESMYMVDGWLHVSGWAYDPETVDPLYVDVLVDGRRTRVIANGSRRDIAAFFPGYGDDLGFDTVVAMPSGSHQVCVEAVGVGAVGNSTLSCSTIVK